MTTNKKKLILGISLFVAIFGILITLASIFDLEVSKILTKSSLEVGKYYSSSIYGRIVEIFGESPMWILMFFSLEVIARFFYRKDSKIKYLSYVISFTGTIPLYELFTKYVTYISRYINDEGLANEWYMIMLFVILGLIISFTFFYFYKNVKEEVNRRLMIFAFIIICYSISYYVVELIKTPVARIRFRTMNQLNDFSYYTPWYKRGSAKEDLSSLVSAGVLLKDGFKSFPSGHTYLSGGSYALMVLPYLFNNLNNKKYKIILTIIPILITMNTAIGRIVVGAHFFSDVLVGGTLAFIFVSLYSFLFIKFDKVFLK